MHAVVATVTITDIEAARDTPRTVEIREVYASA